MLKTDHGRHSAASLGDEAPTSSVQVRESIAGLNVHIAVRSDDAVEENWREKREALDAADARVASFAREVAVLARMT